MPNAKDTLPELIPGHIQESYPSFVSFLEAYYAWLDQPGNPYHHVRHHMDYVSFEKSLDAYLDAMMTEYASGIPHNIAAKKEQLIEWSRKFNLSRGSHESIKFLFKILFNEDSTEIYLPKTNLLRGSDGVWVEDQSVMLVSNTGSTESILYRTIEQNREIAIGVYEKASAVVEQAKVKYSGGFDIIELTMIDVKGEFKEGFPVVTSNNEEFWPVRSVVDFRIDNSGSSYFKNELLVFDAFDQRYINDFTVTESGVVDTRITTLLPPTQIKVEVNGVVVTGFGYDGRYLIGNMFSVNDTVTLTIPQVYVGTMKIGEVDESGAVQSLLVEDAPIAVMPDFIPLSYELAPKLIIEDGYVEQPEYVEYYTSNYRDKAFINKYIDIYEEYDYSDRYTAIKPEPETVLVGFGTGLVAYAETGIVRKVPGYYKGTRGQLSSNMYVIDSNYYQEYSYVIKTEQDISKYAGVMERVLHPAGFKFFGNVRVVSLVDAKNEAVSL